MNKYMLYQGKPVHVKPCTRQQFDTAILDAQRIMGLAKAKSKYLMDHAGQLGEYLEAPKVSSDTWKYATRILALRWPVVRIFVDGYRIMVNVNDLQELGE